MNFLDQVHVEALAEHLFPNAIGHGRMRRIGDISGKSGKSAVVDFKRGVFFDHAEGEGVDLIAVVQQRYGVEWRDMEQWLRDAGVWNGSAVMPTMTKPKAEAVEYIIPNSLDADAALPTSADWLELADNLSSDSALPDEPVEARAYVYRAKNGRVCYIVVRYTMPNGKKEMRTASVRSNGKIGWGGATKHFSYPLYRLEEDEGQEKVLVVEGEKTAEAGAELLTDYWVTAPFGGGNPRPGTVWGAVKGRKVYILGDNDNAGAKFTAIVSSAVRKAGGEVVHLHAQTIYEQLGGEGEAPNGWDLADKVEVTECCYCSERILWNDLSRGEPRFLEDGRPTHGDCEISHRLEGEPCGFGCGSTLGVDAACPTPDCYGHKAAAAVRAELAR